jgi:hypothetical protein
VLRMPKPVGFPVPHIKFLHLPEVQIADLSTNPDSTATKASTNWSNTEPKGAAYRDMKALRATERRAKAQRAPIY